MKKPRFILGCLVLLLLLFAATYNRVFLIRNSGLNSSAQTYVDNNTPILLSTLSSAEFQKRGTKEFNQIMLNQWGAVFSPCKRLGTFEKYEGCTGQSYTSFSYRKGVLFVATYTARAKFQNAEATIVIGLIKHDGQWQIGTFNLDSPIFQQAEMSSNR